MIVYIVTLILIAIFGGLEYKKRLASSCFLEGERIKKKNNIYYYLMVSVFLLVGGLRYRVGTDFGSYYSGWTIKGMDLVNKIITLDEPFIFLLTSACRMIWNDGALVIFVENAITVLLVFKGIRDWEGEAYTMPLMMYILYCGWTDSFNGVRQAMAAAIIFAFSKKGDKYWILKYFIVCFMAFLVHKSAIFVFPILLLANRKIDYRQILIMITVSLIMPVFSSFAQEFMDFSMNDEYSQHSVNIIRVFVAAVPLLFVFVSGKKFRDDNCFLCNMAIITALLSVSTSNSALLYRFTSYTGMYMMLLVPRFAYAFDKRSQKIFKIIVLFLYFAFFIVEIQKGNGNLNNFHWVFERNKGYY